ncbi:hypothetical protein C0991_012449, partial [Blastosporella zonata]
MSTPTQTRELTKEELQEQAMQEQLEDEQIVDHELKQYENAGQAPLLERLSDLTREWEHDEHVFPLLFCVAMDVLPVQASAVSCEHVFSSSKETCSLRRSRLSPKNMEAYDLLAKEEDYRISGPVTSAAVDEL